MSLYQENKVCTKCCKVKNIDKEFTSPTSSWCKTCKNTDARDRKARNGVFNCECRKWGRAGVIKETIKLSGHHPTCKKYGV